MGSMAQDNRHERMMAQAREAVSDLKRKTEQKREELTTLEAELKKAEDQLRFMEDIDASRY